MAFNISDIQKALRYGVARPNKYEVTIVSPWTISVGGIGKELSILCDEAELPGKRISTTPQMLYGVERKMPHGCVYDDLTLSFICSSPMTERKQFDAWMSYINSPNHRYFNYYDQYVGTITVLQLDEQNTPVYYCVFEEAYPIAMLPQKLAYGENDSALRLTITFAYRQWRSAADVLEGSFIGSGSNIPATIENQVGPQEILPNAPYSNNFPGTPTNPAWRPNVVKFGKEILESVQETTNELADAIINVFNK